MAGSAAALQRIDRRSQGHQALCAIGCTTGCHRIDPARGVSSGLLGYGSHQYQVQYIDSYK